MYFPSKKDLRYSLIVWAQIFSGVLVLVFNINIYGLNFVSALNGLGQFLIVLLLVLISLLLWIWLRTGYKIEEGKIKIKSGPLRKTVNIEEINKLSTSKISFAAISPFSGPALSTERIEINYGNHYDVINVSPASRRDFVKILLAENPDIQTDTNIVQ